MIEVNREMSCYILGISCFYHDSAAALIKDGEIIAAAQEERFTRKKHDSCFPMNTVEYCLKEGGIKPEELSFAVFYEKPFLKFERILFSYLSYAPYGFNSFYKAIPLWLKEKLWIPSLISDKLRFRGKVLFTEHHEAHAAACFSPSPFKEAAIITMDGAGEWGTTSIGIGRDNDFDLLCEMRFPHSLGLLYSAFTYYTGFKVNSAEYKVMGLAPYGKPRYADLILKELMDLKEDGSFKLNMKYFNYCAGLTMTNGRFNRLFGGPPREPETEISRKDMDLAKSIQEVTEEIMLRTVRHARKITGLKNLCMSGGVALNCAANGRILKEGPFENIWIQPAAGDAGSAIGAALRIWYKYLGNKRNVTDVKGIQKGSFLGPSFTDIQIEDYLSKNNIPCEKFSREALLKRTAFLINEQKVVGWFQGRMEFGPRALGSRSILGDARSNEMRRRINLKIKFRESFRPFAPTVLAEKSRDYFHIEGDSPFMLFVAKIKETYLKPRPDDEPEGFDKLRIARSEIPAVTHVDYSARIQTISENTENRIYYGLLKEFYELTGCPLIINTSFNVRGEPIVHSPEDAYGCFMRTDMDYLVMGSFILSKKDQPREKHEIKKCFERNRIILKNRSN
jgi:carbamoyltransferase